jgi:hypothetical protein
VTGPSAQYRAFISYSQQDKVWGKRIHTWLETYRVPEGVLAGNPISRRLGRFFMDEEDMAAASDIAELVRKAIESAEHLIVICSPRSAQSKWVNAEIQHYRRTGRANKVFAVIIDGVPNSGDPATECFPPALRAAGDPDDPDALPIEPLGLDVRKDGHVRACARLAAGMLGVDFDDLWQRDRRRAEFRQRRNLGVLAAVSLVFATLAAIAFWQGHQAELNASEARRNASEAQAKTREAEVARQKLQREYLGMLGEAAIDEVLTRQGVPGEIETYDPAWTALMRVGGRQFAVARDYKAGRVLAVAHNRVLEGLNSERGDGFLRRSIEWLSGPTGKTSVVIVSGHCEWLPTRTNNWPLPALLDDWGYAVTERPGVIDDAALTGAAVVIVGNAWGDVTDAEVKAIERFVAKGGGLLAAGLGWSWLQQGADPDLACTGQLQAQKPDDLRTYPMNRVAAPYAMEWTGEAIERSKPRRR